MTFAIFMCESCCSSFSRSFYSEYLHQAPPLTDHSAAFKGFKKFQRHLCGSVFLSEHLNLWRSPLLSSRSHLKRFYK